MKPRLLELLVCPACGEGLELEATALDGAEVMEGALRCPRDGSRYPVSGGVPRFVADAGYAGSFGRQWNWFRTIQLDSRTGRGETLRAFTQTTGWSDAELRGRLVLDAGVGAGRYAEVAAELGAELVGVDLTTAVDAAWANVGHRPRIHLLQADIFSLPFRRESFDHAYSIGVLHHTPDTRAAFAAVARTVRPGGSFAVYLYDAYGPGRRGPDLIRKLTTRLPLGLMWALSAIAVPLHYVYRLPLLGRLLRLLAPISPHPGWRWRWLDTFDWYTPRHQWKFLYPEVYRWYRDCGFGEIALFDGPIRMRGTKARQRPQPEPAARFAEAAAGVR
ncbi:MAG: methyltransferase domain-containing protein [Vicinamibacteria bacterium]